MGSLALLAVVVSASPIQSASHEAAAAADLSADYTRAYGPYELRRAVRAALQAEAKAQSYAEKYRAVQKLGALYRYLGRDTRMIERDRRQLAAQIRLRLRGLEKDVQRDLRRRGEEEDGAGQKDTSLKDYPRYQDSAAAGRPGGAAARFDYGPHLIDLIQNVIAKDQWDVNGGHSTAFYFKPLHALVVAAPSEVHFQLGGLLRGLRAAGR